MKNKKALIESALFISGRVISVSELSKMCGVDSREVINLISELQNDYREINSGIEIIRAGNSFLMQVRPEFENLLLHLAPKVEIPKAMLKTLALIAYEQPVKQSKLVRMRGNRIYYYVKKLREMELIKAKKAGHTRILTTTPRFKEYFKVENIRDIVTEPEEKQEEEKHKEIEFRTK